ncbi:hypothetical protein J2S24_001484 [Thermoanaerobacter pentosaceus]|uniref:Uncharacterized protein n=1 Tax=Thermoanaerobacter pentosaceus TaxID=694059 RepID=A0ABT9M4D4_9THEO|nr:hypothetical protein [Thermoanaerobacter pentosaceus]
MPYIMPQKEKRLKVLRDELEKAIDSIISLNPKKSGIIWFIGKRRCTFKKRYRPLGSLGNL